MSREYIAHEEEYKGLIIKVYPDEDASNPRKEFDNLCTIACSHRRYNLGDEPFNAYESTGDFFRALAIDADSRVQDKIEYWENGNGWRSLMNRSEDDAVKWADEKVNEIIRKTVDKFYIYSPLYLYDHSGITISMRPFSCPWDSGQVGWIYVSIKRFKEETARAGKLKKDGINHELVKIKHLTKKDRERAYRYLEQETEIYNQYLAGDVYRFVIENEDGDQKDSCWECYGLDYCIQQAKEAADYVAAKIAKAEHKQRLFENVLTA